MRRDHPSIRVITILVFCIVMHGESMLSESIGCIFLRDDQSIRCQNTSLQDIGESLHILTMVVKNKPQIIDIDYCGGTRELSPIFRRINASIDTVRIRRSSLQTIHMNAFTSLANTLKDLDLSHNFLSTIPEALSNLWALEHLNLQHNRIVFVRPGSIFDGLTNLREINLANNYIGLADERIDNLTQQNGYQLKASLSMADFNIGRAARSLESLTLTGNRLVTAPLQIFADSWPELRHLDLSENVVVSLNPILHHFLPKLEFLDLHSNRIQTIKIHSIPVTLRYLDITENPLHCDCEARWLHEWQKTNTTTLRLPICNAPEALKGRELYDVSWSTRCQEKDSFQFNYAHNGSDYRDYDVIQLVSSTTEVTVSWRTRYMSDKKKWTVVYRKADDSPYQMTLINPSLRNGKSENLGTETVFTENIQDLQPATTYVVCIAVIREGKYTLEPGKCKEVKTKHFGDMEHELHGDDDKGITLKDAVKTDLEEVSVISEAVTIRWRLIASIDHSAESPMSVRHEWTIRIRRTGSDNYTDIPVYDITKVDDVNDQTYEYSVQDLAPRTHYDVCLVDVDHRVLTDNQPLQEDTTPQSQKDNNNNSMTCRTVVTSGTYALYAAEIVAIAAACAICVVVVGVTVYLCRQKKLLRCRKPKKFKEWVVKCLGNDERPQPIGCSIKYPTATIPRAKCEPKNDGSAPSGTARIGTWNTLRMPYKEFPQVDYSDDRIPASTGYKAALSSVTIYSSGHSEC